MAMTDSHNTLDDLVRVANDLVTRCQYDVVCDAPATKRVRTGSMSVCDRCAPLVGGESFFRDLTNAPAIRRLVAAGVLV